jgi:hypothetical protein
METEEGVASSFEVTAIHTFGMCLLLFWLCSIDTNTTTARITCFSVRQEEEEPANVALIKHSLLGCSPVDPSVAISLQTLELYHRLRRRHGQLGVQAMARTLCDLHDVSPYSFYLWYDSHISQHFR